jgi:beta-glucosidase
MNSKKRSLPAIMVASIVSMVSLAYPQTLEDRLDGIIGKMSTQEKIEQLYYKTDGNARLGIPQFTGSDGPHGIGNGFIGASCFLVNIAMMATWDPGLIERVGAAISLEQASRGRHRIAGPAMDLLHDPRNGRASETIGEDPFLGGRISAAFVKGQNSTAVFGSVKHYNMNTYEANREQNNYIIDQRSLIEFWGAHWKRAVQYGGIMSIMCAYNQINGSKCAENFNLVKTQLRDHWGFDFYTMCDWGGFWSTTKAMNSTLDFCEGNDLYIKELPGLVTAGTVKMEQLNNATKNILRTKVLSGMVDGQPSIPASIRDGAENRKLVYESGLKSIILLKNSDNILPLSKTIGSVAVIGPSAATLPLDGNSSSKVIPTYTITPRQGIEGILGAGKVKYAKGCDINSANTGDFANAVSAAKAADAVVFVGGLDQTMEGEEWFIKGDRIGGSIDLPGQQNALINQLAAANPNLIVVIISAGTCSVNKVVANVKGLLYAFYPGQEGGKAIADVIFGNYNPSGKMPVTMAKTVDQLPATDMDFTNIVSVGVGYRWYDSRKITPEFAFGAGLSYTTFSYSDISIWPASIAAGQEISVRAKVKNTGALAGEEVAQLYLKTGVISPNLAMPVKQLKGFQKVMIKPGETELVEFILTPDDLYVFDTTNNSYKVPTGSFTAMVGGSSAVLPLSGDFTITAAPEKPDLLVTNIRSMPPFPKAGDKVVFLASVLNRGTGPSPANTVHKLTFQVNGKDVSWSDNFKASIPAGGMAMLCASSGPANVNSWTAVDGTNTITATIDSPTVIPECIEDNNNASGNLVLPGGKIQQKEIARPITTTYPRTSSLATMSMTQVGSGKGKKIVYTLPADLRASGHTTLKIFSVDGRLLSNTKIRGASGEVLLTKVLPHQMADSVVIMQISAGKGVVLAKSMIVK